ncbi:MAG: outer membrane lipoprotein carrier protein LolA, partial [Syntrophaceae bacterium]|nr:outer membrane lipoprotein carrier protein LolA [Syntrophaceae bacterium]
FFGLSLLMILFLPPAGAAAWEGWEAFREASRKITAIEARFTQQKTLAILAKPLISTGRFYYQPPRSLRWEYESPVPSVLLMREGTIKRYLKESGKWREDTSSSLPAMQMVLEEITQWQQGRFEANPHFLAELLEDPEPKVILIPREQSWKRMIQRIELTPDHHREGTGVIRSVMMVEDSRSFTVLEFTQVRLDPQFPPSLFEKAQ